MLKSSRFQSSFELTGYITYYDDGIYNYLFYRVSKLFRAYGLYNGNFDETDRAGDGSFKALSSLRVI